MKFKQNRLGRAFHLETIHRKSAELPGIIVQHQVDMAGRVRYFVRYDSDFGGIRRVIEFEVVSGECRFALKDMKAGRYGSDV